MDNSVVGVEETPFEVTRIWPNDPVAVKPGSLPDLKDVVEADRAPVVTPQPLQQPLKTVQAGPFRVPAGGPVEAAVNAPAPAPQAPVDPDIFSDEGLTINYRGRKDVPYGRAATAKAQPFGGIVLHHTGINDTDSAVRYGQTVDPQRGGSFGYHFYIGKDGSIHQGAPLSARTNHLKDPGAPQRKGGLDLDNSNAIGISLVGMGGDYTKEQVEAAQKLAKSLQKRFNIPTSKIFGHGELQSDRQSTEGMDVVKALRTGMAPEITRSLAGRVLPQLDTYITRSAGKYGLDPEYLRAVSLIESSGGRNLKGKGANGAFQFIDGTWTQYGNGRDVMDFDANTDAAARLTLENKTQLQKALGRAPTNAELYLAHQQGATGAIKFLQNPNAKAADLVGLKAIEGNLPRELRGNAGTITAAQFSAFITNKFNQTSSSGAATGVFRDATSPPTVVDFNAPPPAPAGKEWTAAQAEALRIANREEKAGFFDGFKAGFSDNLTGRLVDTASSYYAPDPNFRIDLKAMTEGIDPKFHDRFIGAVSQPHAERIREDILARQTLDERLNRDYGFFTGAGQIIGALADPAAIGVGIATGGAGAFIAEATNLGLAGARVSAGVAGAVGNVLVDTIIPNEAPGIGHLTATAILGAGFGAAFGPLGRNIALSRELATIERVAAQQAKSVKDELMGAVSPQPLEGVVGTGALNDAEALAAVAEKTPTGAMGAVRWSEGGKAATSQNPIVRMIGGILGVDTVGKGKLTNYQSADQIAERMYRAEFSEWRATLKAQFTEWNKRNEHGVLSGFSPAKWQEFNEQATLYVRSQNPFKDSEFAPEVIAAGKTMQKILKQKAEDFNNPLRREGLSGRPLGFLDTNENYVPRVWSPVKMNLAIEEYGIDVVRNTIAGGLLRSTPDMEERVAQRIADHIIKTRAFGYDENLNNLLNAKDLTVFREYMETQIGLAREEVDRLVALFAKKEGGEPSLSNLKRRLGLAEDYEYTLNDGRVLRMVDLFENNADALLNDYLRRSNGRIALAGRRVHDPDTGELVLDGIHTDAEFASLLKMAENRGIEMGMDRTVLNRELEGLQWMYDRLMGRPDPAVFGETAQWLRLLRTFNFARLMGQMGFVQLVDLGAIAGNVGMKAFLQHSRGFAREFQDGRLILKHGLDRELEAAFGMGTDALRQFNALTLEGELHIRAQPNKSMRGQFLQSAQSAADMASQFTSTISGMNVVHSWQQLVFGRAAAQKFADMAVDGTTKRSAKKILRYMGIPPEMEKRVFSQVKKHFDMQDGVLFGRKVTRMNLDKWDDQEAAAVFQNALFRWSRHVIQENDIGAMNRIMSKPLAQTMLQFRSFILTAWENQTLHHIHNFDARSFSTMAFAAVSGAMVYMAQMQLQSLGRSDREEFLASKGLGPTYDWSKLGPAILQRSGWSSVIPMFADTGLNLLGFDGVFNAGISGRASNTIFSNPSVGLLNDVQRAAKGLNQSFQEGRDLTQDEVRAWLRLAPWHTTMPFIQLTSTMIGDRSEPTLRQ